MVDFDLIKKLIKILEEADITALSVEEEGMKIDVRREKGFSQGVVPVGHPQALAHEAVVGGESKAEPVEEEGMIFITSPMVGTFYRAPSSESPPYVEVGNKVEPKKIVCIIESMKLFNEIEAEVSGSVAKILVENGQPVEYGQKLMLIKKE